jgi:hypothetical protein
MKICLLIPALCAAFAAGGQSASAATTPPAARTIGVEL